MVGIDFVREGRLEDVATLKCSGLIPPVMFDPRAYLHAWAAYREVGIRYSAGE